MNDVNSFSFKCTLLITNEFHVKQEKRKLPVNVSLFVGEQARSVRCCLLRDIEDKRRRLFIDSNY